MELAEQVLMHDKQLPIDNLKIDCLFVRDIPDDPNDCAIAAAVISLARTLGLEAVSEGVETAQQEQYLRGGGCRTVQRYRYAQLISAEALLVMLATLRAAGAKPSEGRVSQASGIGWVTAAPPAG
ncbi:MAG TPA: EAL domain-containing protein [Acidiferrobacterales bacterium]|nr:EAL domain-containing protein [Acidiferrobacterales bacterium]